MKVVILAGGLGTRLSEETDIKPKPMIEIGGKPIIWHIMKIYSSYGYNDFVICLGYRGYLIKEYFANYFLHQTDITIDLKLNEIEVHNTNVEPWKVTLVDTGRNTMTGGRIARVKKYLDNKPFMLTYGDGLSNVNIEELVSFHKKSDKIATVTSVQPHGRFGAIKFDNQNVINEFREKPQEGAWVNGGFFVLQPEVFNYINTNEKCVWERDSIEKLVAEKQLTAFQHKGFWHPMDTLRDKHQLESLWNSKNCEWRIWE